MSRRNSICIGEARCIQLQLDENRASAWLSGMNSDVIGITILGQNQCVATILEAGIPKAAVITLYKNWWSSSFPWHQLSLRKCTW
jgi:hypothetical protein